MEGPQCNPKFFMWVVPSPLFSRRRGPHIKNLGWGPKWGMWGAFLYVYVLFSLSRKGGLSLIPDRANGRGGLGRKLLLTLSGDPSRAPEKQTVATVAASHKMLTLQALSS